MKLTSCYMNHRLYILRSVSVYSAANIECLSACKQPVDVHITECDQSTEQREMQALSSLMQESPLRSIL